MKVKVNHICTCLEQIINARLSNQVPYPQVPFLFLIPMQSSRYYTSSQVLQSMNGTWYQDEKSHFRTWNLICIFPSNSVYGSSLDSLQEQNLYCRDFEFSSNYSTSCFHAERGHCLVLCLYHVSHVGFDILAQKVQVVLPQYCAVW